MGAIDQSGAQWVSISRKTTCGVLFDKNYKSRRKRDSYLAGIEGGKAEICEYYHVAPTIVSNIKKLPDSLKIFEKIYDELVLPCVKSIDEGKNEDADKLYRSYTLFLKERYI